MGTTGRTTQWKALVLCALLACTGAVAAAEGQHVFWQIDGKHNTVYLLGSIHLLPSDQRTLPEVANAAYADAEVIVEELDLLAASGDMLSAEALALQMLPEGKTLPGVLGAALHQRLVDAIKPLGMDPDFLVRMQPWYVAMMVTQLRFLRGGFSPQDGVDYQIAMRAQKDAKPLKGLETAVEQLGLFASMPMPEQIELLKGTLDESSDASELRKLTDAWHAGNLPQLESLLRQGAEESPEVFKVLVTDRNLRWIPEIETMLQHPSDDYLVVTGAAHMLGQQGLVELLRRKGYTVTRH